VKQRQGKRPKYIVDRENNIFVFRYQIEIDNWVARQEQAKKKRPIR